MREGIEIKKNKKIFSLLFLPVFIAASVFQSAPVFAGGMNLDAADSPLSPPVINEGQKQKQQEEEANKTAGASRSESVIPSEFNPFASPNTPVGQMVGTSPGTPPLEREEPLIPLDPGLIPNSQSPSPAVEKTLPSPLLPATGGLSKAEEPKTEVETPERVVEPISPGVVEATPAVTHEEAAQNLNSTIFMGQMAGTLPGAPPLEREEPPIPLNPEANKEIPDSQIKIPKNLPPAVDSVAERTILKGKINEKYPDVPLSIFFNDPEDDKLTFIVTGLPAGMTVNQDGVLQGTPQRGSGGNYVLKITATDPGGLSVSFDMKFEIELNSIREERYSRTEDFQKNPGNARDNFSQTDFKESEVPLEAREQKPIKQMEGASILIDVRKMFMGSDKFSAVLTVEGLPPGLRLEEGNIIGQLQYGIARDYTITVTATPPNGTPVKATLPMTVIPRTGNLVVDLPLHYLNQAFHDYNSYKLAQDSLAAMPPTKTEAAFTASYSQIAKIPYIHTDDIRFNCDFFSTCTLLASGHENNVYELAFAIYVKPDPTKEKNFFEQWVSDLGLEYPPEHVYHELNLVWLERINNKYDVYGLWESIGDPNAKPPAGKFVTRFIMPASDKDPTEIPAEALHQYIMASGFVPPGGSYILDPERPVVIDPNPGLEEGNYSYHVPLLWTYLTMKYLDPDLAQRIQAGVPSIRPIKYVK